jgi:hypothetical protein
MSSSDTVVVIGIDAGHHDRVACEHQALDLSDRLGGATHISIHIVPEPEPHPAAPTTNAGFYRRSSVVSMR